MRLPRHITLNIVLSVCLVLLSDVVPADPAAPELASVDDIYPLIEVSQADPPGSELTDMGRNVRGIYLPVPKIANTPIDELVKWVVEKVGATAVIVDVKDDSGRVTFTRELEGATRRFHGNYPRMPELVAAMQASNVYVIGRLVSFKDNMFHKVTPDAGVRDVRDGEIWQDGIGTAWSDPYSEKARAYIVRIASAAQEVGFDEIQLDYVRFPVDALSRYARYPNRIGKSPRYEAIVALLERVDQVLSIPLSIDVFGLTAYRRGDPNGLGQSLEHLAPHIDAISPMLYLANFNQDVWEDPDPMRIHDLVHRAVLGIRERLGDNIAVRPLLQAFPYRAQHFGRDFIAHQIDAATTAGSSGHLFWNQGGHYRPVAQVWRRLKSYPRTSIHPHILTPHHR